jgi:hypothetical protein
MQIADLLDIEDISKSDWILGSAGATVTAEASATGNSSETSAFTESVSASLPKDGSLAIGTGFATAVGTDPTTDVTVAGAGGSVTTKNYSRHSKYVSVSAGVVVAIDLPSYKRP